MVRLVPMTEAHLERMLETLLPEYAQEHVKAGNWSAEEALARAEQQVRELLPEGVATPEHFLYVVEDIVSGEQVGELWAGRQERGGKSTAFIYNVRIFDAHKRKGYGSQALQALEEEMREIGLNEITLNVFGSNVAARALYQQLGYEELNVYMGKRI